jgi:hypothetical protein
VAPLTSTPSATASPPSPRRVEPNDGLDGYIDTEGLADQIYIEGEKDRWIETHAYVDLIGFGMKKIDLNGESE